MFRRLFSKQYPVSIQLFFKLQATYSKQCPDCSLNRALLKTKSDWLWNNNLLFSLSRLLSHCWSCYDKAESTQTQTIGYSSFLSKSSLVLVRAVSHPFVYVSKSRENDTRRPTLDIQSRHGPFCLNPSNDLSQWGVCVTLVWILWCYLREDAENDERWGFKFRFHL